MTRGIPYEKGTSFFLELNMHWKFGVRFNDFVEKTEMFYDKKNGPAYKQTERHTNAEQKVTRKTDLGVWKIRGSIVRKNINKIQKK